MNAMQMLALSPEADRLDRDARRCVDEQEQRRGHLGDKEAQRAYRMYVADLACRAMREEMQPIEAGVVAYSLMMLPGQPEPPAAVDLRKHLDAIAAKWNGVVKELL